MVSPWQPDTLDVANKIVDYLAAQTYSGGGNVYTAGQLGFFKDMNDLLPINSTNAVYEVHGNMDDSHRYSLGGKMRDTQTFVVLSMVDMTDGNAAEIQIMQIRDAIMPQFAKHVSLEDTGNVLVAKYKQGSGRFTHVMRGARVLRAHTMDIEVLSEWTAQNGFVA